MLISTPPGDYYRQVYFDVLDLVNRVDGDCLDKPGYHVHQNVQQLFLKASKGQAYQDDLETVFAIYKVNLSRQELEAQLPLLEPLCRNVCEELANNFLVHNAVQ